MDEIFEEFSLTEWFCFIAFVLGSAFLGYNLRTAVWMILILIIIVPIFLKYVAEVELPGKKWFFIKAAFVVGYPLLLSLIFNEGAAFDIIHSPLLSKLACWISTGLVAIAVYFAIRYKLLTMENEKEL